MIKSADKDKVAILLVDDRRDKLLALQTVLEGLNERLVMVTSGEDALRALLREDFAAIILDVNMPGMDGFETAALIRKRKRTEHTPIIFVTGINMNENHVSRGYSLGAVDYIFTPVEPVVLRSKVSVFIDLFRKTRQIQEGEEALRRAAEEALRESEGRYHFLIEALPQLVWTSQPDGNWDYVSQQWCQYTGLPPEKQLGLEWNKLVHEDDRQLTIESWKSAISKSEIFNVEHRLRSKEGSFRWHKTRALPILDESGNVTNWFGTCTDINDQKLAVAALEDSGRLKDEFLAMLSHELRNPLNAISGAVQLAVRKPSAEMQGWSLEIIQRQVKQLARLIDDLLDVSRITRGKIQLRKEIVMLDGIIANAVSAVQSLIESRSHELSVSFPENTIALEGDPARLEQIIVNLLANAAKYTEKGGRIWVNAKLEGDQIALSIRDTGIGIQHELLSKIFELFSQVDRSLDRSQGGLGIGLTVAKKLAELHGGSISVHSDGLGRGSTFTLRLPAALTNASLLSPLKPRAHWEFCSSLRVLVVDDHLDTLDTTTMLLEQMGCEVAKCSESSKVVDLAATFDPSLILMDIGLPGINGYELARLIRSHERLRCAVLAAVSGYGQDSDKKQSVASGFDVHLVKPLDIDQLFTSVLPLLKRKVAADIPAISTI